ncbi:MAG: hypothetical protein ACRC62_01515 [Microcoleus sp.]
MKAVNCLVRRHEIVDRCLGWLVAMHHTTINCQLSIDRERGRSHYNSQLSTLNRSMRY